jgi:hypothetical protein
LKKKAADFKTFVKRRKTSKCRQFSGLFIFGTKNDNARIFRKTDKTGDNLI